MFGPFGKSVGSVFAGAFEMVVLVLIFGWISIFPFSGVEFSDYHTGLIWFSIILYFVLFLEYEARSGLRAILPTIGEICESPWFSWGGIVLGYVAGFLLGLAMWIGVWAGALIALPVAVVGLALLARGVVLGRRQMLHGIEVCTPLHKRLGTVPVLS